MSDKYSANNVSTKAVSIHKSQKLTLDVQDKMLMIRLK